MMKRTLGVFVAVLSIAAASCSRDKDKRNSPAPPLDSYEVTVTGIDVVNKDSGEPLEVSGLPVEGGTLTVQ
jgi:hypothetical protein